MLAILAMLAMRGVIERHILPSGVRQQIGADDEAVGGGTDVTEGKAGDERGVGSGVGSSTDTSVGATTRVSRTMYSWRPPGVVTVMRSPARACRRPRKNVSRCPANAALPGSPGSAVFATCPTARSRVAASVPSRVMTEIPVYRMSGGSAQLTEVNRLPLDKCSGHPEHRRRMRAAPFATAVCSSSSRGCTRSSPR